MLTLVESSVEPEATKPTHLGADRRLRTVTRVDPRVRRQLRDSHQARLHRRRVATGQIDTSDVALEEHIPGKERSLAGKVKARRTLGVPRRVHGPYLDVREIADRSLLDEVVRIAWRDIERRWWSGCAKAVCVEPMDREPSARGFLHRGVAEDVIGMAVRVEDLHEPDVLVAQRVERDTFTHGRI